jgi:hypothetical protein
VVLCALSLLGCVVVTATQWSALPSPPAGD